jgi:hypothetical protein
VTHDNTVYFIMDTVLYLRQILCRSCSVYDSTCKGIKERVFLHLLKFFPSVPKNRNLFKLFVVWLDCLHSSILPFVDLHVISHELNDLYSLSGIVEVAEVKRL